MIIENVTEEDEIEILKRYRLAKARMQEARPSNYPVPQDDFSISSIGSGQQVDIPFDGANDPISSIIGSNEELMRAIIVGIGGALGSEFHKGPMGAGAGAGLASILFDALKKGKR